MPDDLPPPRAAGAANPPDLTLNAEVHRICVVEGGYPDHWPRHRVCPCCGAGELRGIFAKYGFNHDQCIDCGFVCVNPYPPADILQKLYAGAYYTNFREFYEADHLRKEGGESLTAAPLELLEKMIEQATAGRGPGDWLDVGGGLGTVADLVRRRRPNWRVALNELNPRSMQLAREIFEIEVVGSNAGELREAERRFDVISAVQVLEHTTDPLAFLNSYAALLKPDGVIVVIVPHFTHLNAMVSKGASAVVAPPFHASLFREPNLRTILRRVRPFERLTLSQFGPAAFSLLHHYDTSDYWDISIPTVDEPLPKSLMVKEYPTDVAVALNRLGEADPATADHFADTDGRLYLLAVAAATPIAAAPPERGPSRWKRLGERLRGRSEPAADGMQGRMP